ncbi:MAG: hypothetical protein KAI81_05675, partial [Candidatus Marinimicrobia bacterium]|nr:hypothetical protein [Candidatus Neomarinimicrobiota bacterium]
NSTDSTDFPLLSLDELKKRWPDIINEIGAKKPALFGILPKLDLSLLENGKLTAYISDGFAFDMLNKMKLELDSMISKVIGNKISLNLQKTVDSKENKTKAKTREIDDNTQLLIQAFDGEII